MTLAPVNVAMSSKTLVFWSPYFGALIATALNTPFNLFSTSVVNASPSTSSAIRTRSFFPA